MSYTTVTVSRPGAKMRSGTTADEANANFAEVQAIVAANGGEMSLVGYDHARAANVAIVTYPDADAAATAFGAGDASPPAARARCVSRRPDGPVSLLPLI